jgi:hypothetical protein
MAQLDRSYPADKRRRYLFALLRDAGCTMRSNQPEEDGHSAWNLWIGDIADIDFDIDDVGGGGMPGAYGKVDALTDLLEAGKAPTPTGGVTP